MKKARLTLLLLLFFLCIHAQSNKTVYNIYDFGAKGDGITNDQIAIQKAIDACKEKGGTVVLEKGTFLTG